MGEETEKPVDAISYEQKLQAVAEYAKNLEFFSDTIRFRKILYDGMSKFLNKLSEIEARIILLEDKGEKPKEDAKN